jgi:hypothetical protein
MARPLLNCFDRATEVVVSDGLKTGGDANFIARHMMRLAGMLFLFFILFVDVGYRFRERRLFLKMFRKTQKT